MLFAPEESGVRMNEQIDHHADLDVAHRLAASHLDGLPAQRVARPC